MLRTQLAANPHGRRLHDLVLDACRRFPQKTAVVDSSCGRRIGYAEYGELVERLARGLVAAGLKAGEAVAICHPNSWEFCASYHATTLAGGFPTLLNPAYREREVRFHLETSGAAMLISDGVVLQGMNLAGLPDLRRVYSTRQHCGTQEFADLLRPTSVAIPAPTHSSQETVAALPFSSGTTGLPKGVMLSHYNLVANIYQLLGPGTVRFGEEVVLCFLPLYHIYGLNVILNPVLASGGTLVLMPRFQVPALVELLQAERVTMMPLVPPAMNALCQAAEAGQFPADHSVGWVKSGAAPLAPELARRFTALTGILIRQGYGMTEASPVTHVGFLEPELYRPESIGQPVAQTDCRILGEADREVGTDQPGELVMRGPQFMLGYWKDPRATESALRDGWYWSGDIVSRDAQGFYYILDRRKEMIKYKGFPVAPAEIEAVLLEHPAVCDCGVVGRSDAVAGEIPVAFIVLREGFVSGEELQEDVRSFVAERLTHYKQPREIRFVEAVPKSPSGKILRRELRKALA